MEEVVGKEQVLLLTLRMARFIHFIDINSSIHEKLSPNNGTFSDYDLVIMIP